MLFNNPINYANIIAGTIAAVVGLLIFLKNKKDVLNQFFFVSLFAWGVSFVFNALTFVYTDPDAIGVEIFRDIATGAGSVAAFLLFASALVLLKGPHFISKWHVMIPFVVVMMVNTIIGCLFDEVVFDNEIGVGVKTTQDPWVMIFIYIIPMLMISSAVGIFIKIRTESSDKLVRRRILFFILGFSFLVCGTIVFALGGIVEHFIGSLNVFVEYLVWILAEIFWASSPIFLLVGFYVKTQVEEEEVVVTVE
ncbi:MAG: hypothetical protein ACTSP7_06640 [Candidatus Heimdallarchaeota archaeon]